MFQRVLLDFVLKTFGLGAENETRNSLPPNILQPAFYRHLEQSVLSALFILVANINKKSESVIKHPHI